MSSPETAHRFLRGTAQAIALLVREKNLERAIRLALEIVGAATDADRSYFWRCFYDENQSGRASQIIEWNSGSATPQIHNPELQDIPFSRVDSFVRPLLKDEPLIGIVRELPPDSRSILEPQGIVSLIVMPIWVREQLWGFVGFDDCTHERTWSEDELSILLSFAASISGAAERSLAEKENKMALEGAQAANRAKEAFIANVSHEIRTPLNAIIGYSELMQEAPDPLSHAEYLRGMKAAGHILLSLINNILDLATIEQNQIILAPERMEIAQLIEELSLVFRPQLEAKGLTLELHVDRELPPALMTDPLRFRQILYNLTSNAIKFTHSGKVTISFNGTPAGKEHIDLMVTVADTGIGIDPAIQERIFDPFYQAETDESRRFQGTGLGLSITKKIVELMNGSLHLTSSQEPGSSGTTFRIDIPGMVLSLNPADGRKTATWSFENTQVLVVDDIGVNRMLLETFLESAGIRAIEAEDGVTALSLVRLERPDLILLDVQMPGMSGEEVLRELKEDPLTRNIPVVIVTASTIGRNTEHLQDFADGFLYKPLYRDTLLTEIDRLIEHKRSTKRTHRPGTPHGETNTESNSFAPFADAAAVRERFLSEWHSVNELQSIDDISAFAHGIAQHAQEHRNKPLAAWAEKLLSQCDAFEIDALERTFALFLPLAGASGGD